MCKYLRILLTPTGYPLPTHTQQPASPTAHTAHNQHCGHTALPPGQKTNPRRRADLLFPPFSDVPPRHHPKKWRRCFFFLSRHALPRLVYVCLQIYLCIYISRKPPIRRGVATGRVNLTLTLTRGVHPDAIYILAYPTHLPSPPFADVPPRHHPKKWRRCVSFLLERSLSLLVYLYLYIYISISIRVCAYLTSSFPHLQTSLPDIIRRNGGAASLFSLSVLYRTMYLCIHISMYIYIDVCVSYPPLLASICRRPCQTSSEEMVALLLSSP